MGSEKRISLLLHEDLSGMSTNTKQTCSSILSTKIMTSEPHVLAGSHESQTIKTHVCHSDHNQNSKHLPSTQVIKIVFYDLNEHETNFSNI